MPAFFETYRGMVYPWQCDTMGHLNTQHYVGVFDQTLLQLIARMGFSPSDEAYADIGWADVKHTIEYLREAVAGTAIWGESAIIGIGTKSLTTRHVLRIVNQGEPIATLEAVTVCFDLKERRAMPIPDDLRGAAKKMCD
jgi:acyl-CoA thioester hydrolase